MNYKDLFINKISLLRELMFFKESELEPHWIDSEVFNKWIEAKYIIPQYEDIYSLTEDHIEVTELTSIFLAQKYDSSAYLSGESALKDYDISLSTLRCKIFFTTNENKEISLKYKNLIFFSTYVPNHNQYIKEEYVHLWNKAIWLKSNTIYKIASLELALVDFLSIWELIQDENDFEDYWFDWRKMKEKLNNNLLLEIAKSTKIDYVIKSTENLLLYLKKRN